MADAETSSGQMDEVTWKHIIGRSISVAYSKSRRRFEDIVDARDWKSGKHLCVSVLLAFGEATDNDEFIELRRLIDLYDGSRSRQQYMDGMHLIEGIWVDQNDIPFDLPPRVYELAYDTKIFNETFWHKIDLMVVRRVGMLFDANIQAAFTAALLEEDNEKKITTMEAGDAIIEPGADLAAMAVKLHRYAQLDQLLEAV